MVGRTLAKEAVIDYYSSESRLEEYSSSAAMGLTELERRAIERHLTPPDTSVLDVGCGAGRTTAALDRMGFDVVGLDITESVVERAKELFPEIPFFTGDVCALPFDSESFDCVLFSYFGLDDIPSEDERYRALGEIWRVLRDGGTFIFSAHNLWSTYIVRRFDSGGILDFVAFWIQNVREGRIFERFKRDNFISGEKGMIYYIRPADQKRQLRQVGFVVEETIREDGILRPYFAHPYYVARKP